MYEVFEVVSGKKDVMDDILSDDLISKQNTNVREGSSLGFKEGVTYAMVEGTEEAVEKAIEMFEEEGIEPAENREEVKEKLEKKPEDSIDLVSEEVE